MKIETSHCALSNQARGSKPFEFLDATRGDPPVRPHIANVLGIYRHVGKLVGYFVIDPTIEIISNHGNYMRLGGYSAFVGFRERICDSHFGMACNADR